MTLEEIKTAVRSGKKVHWSNQGYLVHLHTFPDGKEQWSIIFTANDHCIGLTHQDGITLNGKPEEFFIGEPSTMKRTRLEMISELKASRPNVSITVTAEYDDDHVWDGDGNDPAEDGFICACVTVSASLIHEGEIHAGESHLGGSYAKDLADFNIHSDDEGSDYNIHGYFPQMMDEALAELDRSLPEPSDRSLIVVKSKYDTIDRSKCHDSWSIAADMSTAKDMYQRAIDQGADIASICAVIESTDYDPYKPIENPVKIPEGRKAYLVHIQIQSGGYEKQMKKLTTAYNETDAARYALLSECHCNIGKGAEWMSKDQIEDCHGDFIYSLCSVTPVPESQWATLKIYL